MDISKSGLVTLRLSPRESCFVVFSYADEQLDDKAFVKMSITLLMK